MTDLNKINDLLSIQYFGGTWTHYFFIKVKYKQSNLSYVKCINIYNISKNINTSSYKITKCEKFGKINLKIFWKMDIYKCPIFEF